MSDTPANSRFEGIQGIQSIEVGAPLLEALAAEDGPMTLSALAQAAGMGPSKARRYLVSFARIGLVEQLENGGRYALGPMALRLGLSALGQVDVVRSGSDVIRELAEKTGFTSALIVWSDHGPTAVRFERSRGNIGIHIRVGSTIPLLSSAAGRLFAAYLPDSVTAPFVDAELARAEADSRVRPLTAPGALERLYAEIRERGFAYVDGFVIHGLRAAAAPVFDAEGVMTAALVIFGPVTELDIASDGRIIPTLLTAARDLSGRLGYQ